MATNDRQQATTKYTSRLAGDTPVILLIVTRNVAICEPRKTRFVAPENKLIVSVPWPVNRDTNRCAAGQFAVSKTA
jgi:hypothetical protein